MAGGTEEIPTLSAEVFVLTFMVRELLGAVIRAGIYSRAEAVAFVDTMLRVGADPGLAAINPNHPITTESIASIWADLRADLLACELGPQSANPSATPPP